MNRLKFYAHHNFLPIYSQWLHAMLILDAAAKF